MGCRHCGSEELVKDGIAGGKQRYKCKSCKRTTRPDDKRFKYSMDKRLKVIKDMGYKQHYRVKHSDDVFANGRAHVNGIENFWGIAKTRLVKFRGITSKMFYLHLKETEFRFNLRHDDLFRLCCLILEIHLSKLVLNLIL